MKNEIEILNLENELEDLDKKISCENNYHERLRLYKESFEIKNRINDLIS